MIPEHKKELETTRRRLVRLLGRFYGSVKFNLNSDREKNPRINTSICNVKTEIDGVEVEESVKLEK